MRALYIFVLALLLASCTSLVEIKGSGAESPSIKTTKIDATEEPDEIKPEPSIKIISPKDLQLIKNSTIIVEVEAENFRIVPLESPARNGEGHFHVWLNGEKKVSQEKILVFENVAPAQHSITAELVKSNHSSLTPKVAKTITINVQYETLPKLEQNATALSEYYIEADDDGFYPGKIRARLSNKVVIHFKFRDHLIYFAGLDIRGPFEDVKYQTGGQQPVSRNFTMKGETKIVSYWPSSGVKKAELTVEVEK